MGNVGNGTNIKVGELTFVDNRNFPGGPNAYFATGAGPVGLTCNVVYIINTWFQDGLLVRIHILLDDLTKQLIDFHLALPILDVFLPTRLVLGCFAVPYVPGFSWYVTCHHRILPAINKKDSSPLAHSHRYAVCSRNHALVHNQH